MRYFLYPSTSCICGGIYCFHIVRLSVCPAICYFLVCVWGITNKLCLWTLLVATKMYHFSSFSMKTYVVNTHKTCLTKADHSHEMSGLVFFSDKKKKKKKKNQNFISSSCELCFKCSSCRFLYGRTLCTF